MASISANKKTGIYYLWIKIDGKWKGISLRTKKLNEARKHAKEIEQKHSGLSLSKLYENWELSKFFRSDRYKKDVKNYMIKFIKEFGDVSASSITKDNLFDYQMLLYNNGLNENSIGIIMRGIKAVFNHGYKEELVPTRPFLGFSILQGEHRTSFLSKSEIQKLLEAASERPLIRLYIEFILVTGCRVGELKNLGWAQINDYFIEFYGKETVPE